MFNDIDSQLEGIREIFAEAKQEDNWNTDEPMLYSFYFVDRNAEKLRDLGLKLEDEGYDFVGVYELGEEGSDEPNGEYLLHIDKVEIHTPESVAQRNVEFQKLADEFELEAYDGWEFGEIGEEEDEE